MALTYSLLNTRWEYQIAWIEEQTMWNNLSQNVYAASANKTAQAKIMWTYNWQILKVSTWSIDYILAVPSIINSDVSDKDLLSIISKKQLAYNWYGNLPDTYKWLWYIMTWSFNFGWAWFNPVIFSWSSTSMMKDLSSSWTLQIAFVNNLQSTYGLTQVVNDWNIKQVLNSTTTTDKQNLVSWIFNNKFWWLNWNVVVSSWWWWGGGWWGGGNSCTIPVPTNATLTVWSPTSPNQARQNTNWANPCYFTCSPWYNWNWSSCVLTPYCSSSTPSNSTLTTWSPTIANQSRQNITSSNPCYYTCSSWYWWNWSSCISASSCTNLVLDITLSNGQTWSCINLWATTVRDWSTQPNICGNSQTNCNSWNSWIWNYYQRWRNDVVNGSLVASAFSWPLSSGYTNTNLLYQGVWYNWDNYYQEWWQDELGFTNLNTTRWIGTNPQWPCPYWRHVPSQSEWYSAAVNVISWYYENMPYDSSLTIKLKLPFSGFRWFTWWYDYQTLLWEYWSSTATSNTRSNALDIRTSMATANTYRRANAFNRRCIKNP
jgi:hypothetical protein